MHIRHRHHIDPRDFYDEISKGGSSANEMTRTLLMQTLSQQNEATPLLQHHPLGFFCIRWDLEKLRTIRIHIWNRQFNWTQKPNWSIHDHIFSFKSAVLYGLLQNKTYTANWNKKNGRNWTAYQVLYSGQKSTMIPLLESVELRVSTLNCQAAGSIYELPAGTFHRSTLRSQSAITVLATQADPTTNSSPRVIGTNNCTLLHFNRQQNLDETTKKIIRDAIAWLDL